METPDKIITTPNGLPPVLRAVHDRLLDVWVVYKDSRDALMERINTFIGTSLYGAFRELDCGGNENPKSRNIYSRNKSSKSNRNSRQRYSYARCQESFHKCPKMLADAVINNDRVYLKPA
jgi:hypothetical protein